jgi:hypothetical protein
MSVGLLPACFSPITYAPTTMRPFASQPAVPVSMVQYRPIPQWTFANYAPRIEYLLPDAQPSHFTQALERGGAVEGKADAVGILLNRDGSLQMGDVCLANEAVAESKKFEPANLEPTNVEPKDLEATTIYPRPPDSLAPVSSTEIVPPSAAVPGKLESPLLSATRCFIEKHDKEAQEALKGLDSESRRMLCAMMPLAASVSEGGLDKVDPQSAAALIDQLEQLVWSLRPHAALLMNRFCFCRSVRKYSSFDPIGDHPTFQPGEMVEVYAEIRNVYSEPHRTSRGDFRTHLFSTLDLRQSSGECAWDGPKAFDKPDETMTPQNDYYQHFRFQMPPLPPGTYYLELEVQDMPTGRKVRRKLEFSIGPPVQVARDG